MASSSLSTRVDRSSVVCPEVPFRPSRCWCGGMASSSAFTRALMATCSGCRHQHAGPEASGADSYACWASMQDKCVLQHPHGEVHRWLVMLLA